LPFLRFTRDKRGYETTSLVHAVRRQGRARQRILYWFRTPPGVKVGRPALDQEAIQWIEEHNPDIEFDWPTILEAQPQPSAPPGDDGKARRVRRDKPDRGRPATTPEAGRRRQPPTVPAPPDIPVPSALAALPAVEMTAEDITAEDVSADEIRGDDIAAEDMAAGEVTQDALGPVSPGIQLAALDETALDETELDEAEIDAPTASELVGSTMGPEQLTRLRARYAELLARITERGGEPARVEDLRAQAEPLDPDTWVTEEEIRKGLQEFDPKVRDLRAALGLRRRRRSRRGGRRRKGPEPAVESQEPTEEG
jgi:hypothetical protein